MAVHIRLFQKLWSRPDPIEVKLKHEKKFTFGSVETGKFGLRTSFITFPPKVKLLCPIIL